MKIYAKQVPPEYQESPFQFCDWMNMWPGVIIHGNRQYNSYTTPEFDAIYDRFDDEKRILRALHLATGKRYEARTIRGSCRGDWQEIYYPVSDYTREALDVLECEYFNLGSEWIIDDTGDTAPCEPGDVVGWSMYCHAWSTDEIRAEIAAVVGCNTKDVILYEFDGWTQTPRYKEVTSE